MSRLMGGILGSLLMLIPAALLLLASQGRTCSNKWLLTCTPGSDAVFTAQLIGGLLLILGPTWDTEPVPTWHLIWDGPPFSD